MRVEVLRLAAELLIGALAERDEKVPVAIEDQPRAEMLRARLFRRLREDHLHIGKRAHVLAERSARDGG